MKCDKDMKIFYWSNDDIDYLKKNYFDTEVKDLADKLSRTKESIKSMAKKLKLRKKPKQSKKKIFGKEVIYVTQTFEIGLSHPVRWLF